MTGNVWMFWAGYDANNKSLNANEWLVWDGVAKLCLLWNIWYTAAEAEADAETFGGPDNPFYQQAMRVRPRVVAAIGPPSGEKVRGTRSKSTGARKTAMERTHTWQHLLLSGTGRGHVLSAANQPKNGASRLVDLCSPELAISPSRDTKTTLEEFQLKQAKESIARFLEKFTPAWVRINKCDIPTNLFNRLTNAGLRAERLLTQAEITLDKVQLTLTSGEKTPAPLLGLFRMFWGSVAYDFSLRPERTTWAAVQQEASLARFQLIDESDKSQAASPLPIGLLVRWGRLLHFGPDLTENCSAKEADDFTLVEPRLAVWRAFCGAESEEAAPDGTRLRGTSLQDFAKALQGLIESEDTPTMSIHGVVYIPAAKDLAEPLVHGSTGIPADEAISAPALPLPLPKFMVKQDRAFPGAPLSVSLMTKGPPFSIRALRYKFPRVLPELPEQVYNRIMIKQLTLSVDLDCDRFDLQPVRANGLETTPGESNGMSRFVKVFRTDTNCLPPDTDLCSGGHLVLGDPEITDVMKGSISAYFDPQHISFSPLDGGQGLSSPFMTQDSAMSQAQLEIAERIRSNSTNGHFRIGDSHFDIEPAP